MARDYFSQYPKAYFKRQSSLVLPGGKTTLFDVEVTDIFVKFKIRDAFLSNANLFYPYLWKDTDRPDTVAHRYYGSEKYHWVVFYSNGSFDLNYDFPMKDPELREFMFRKYDEQCVEDGLESGFLITRAIFADIEVGDQGKFVLINDGTFYDYRDFTVPRAISKNEYCYKWLAATTKFFQIEGKYEVDETRFNEAVLAGDSLAKEVTFLQFEEEANEAKRNVQLLDNEYFLELVKNFRNDMARVNNERAEING